jgi:hypothetical protein
LEGDPTGIHVIVGVHTVDRIKHGEVKAFSTVKGRAEITFIVEITLDNAIFNNPECGRRDCTEKNRTHPSTTSEESQLSIWLSIFNLSKFFFVLLAIKL